MERLDHLPIVRETSQSLTPSPTRWNAEKIRNATATLGRLVAGIPDRTQESPEWSMAMVECLASLTDEERGWLTDPREGLATVCRFLPTPADVHDLLRKRHARADQFKPAGIASDAPASSSAPRVAYSMAEYHAMKFYPNSPEAEAARARLAALGAKVEFEANPDQEAQRQRRRQVVKDALGYNPDERRPKVQLEKPTAETVDQLLANLKTPPTPPSKELIELVRRQNAGEVEYPDAHVTGSRS